MATELTLWRMDGVPFYGINLRRAPARWRAMQRMYDEYLSITGPVLLARAMPGVAFRPGAQTVGGTRVPGTQDVVISGEDADYIPKDNYGYLTLARQVYA